MNQMAKIFNGTPLGLMELVMRKLKSNFFTKTKCEILEIFLDHQKENEKPVHMNSSK